MHHKFNFKKCKQRYKLSVLGHELTYFVKNVINGVTGFVYHNFHVTVKLAVCIHYKSLKDDS